MKVKVTLLNEVLQLTDMDYLRESVELREQRFSIIFSEITKDQSDFIAVTGCIMGVSHGRTTDGDEITHEVCIDAADLITWCRRIFCPQEPDIAPMLNDTYEAIIQVDSTIGEYLVSDCVYRNGICTREKPCGRSINVLQNLISLVPEAYYRDARNEKALKDQQAERSTLCS